MTGWLCIHIKYILVDFELFYIFKQFITEYADLCNTDAFFAKRGMSGELKDLLQLNHLHQEQDHELLKKQDQLV